MSASSSSSSPVVICGAGVIGASIAYHLALRGVHCLVVDRCPPATGASGKAGGFLAKDWCDTSALKHLARKSFDLHQELAAIFGEEYGYRRLDTLSLASAAPELQRRAKKAKLTSLPEWLDGYASASSVMGSIDTTAQVHPELFTKTLLNAAIDNGSSFRQGEVKNIVRSSTGAITGVVVDDDVIPTNTLVIAMGPWSALAAEWLPIPKVTTIKAHSIVLVPPQPVTPHAIFVDYQMANHERIDPEIYPRPDGTVYVCGFTETVSLPARALDVLPSEGTGQRLSTIAGELSSTLRSSELRSTQACFLPLSPDDLPIIGAVPDVQGAYIATGHSCWGILNAPVTGLAMAELIVDGKASTVDLSPFDPKRFTVS